ncbi:class I adenylate-forming enzyme family protein [Pseudomonas sp. PDM31]|uniref:class I adenylate-forming enzyme family protein n=1 Tax=Pseudomonas sp. PDM31 TaxID=2854778 RepID=UPI001C459243|nr:fatty acid--CoA ligase family protein [Pseudomonas sp. PDM31]MBV7477629.1 fatty acid--CoA ligase family protein [Pseudomonas sp. PDM31]
MTLDLALRIRSVLALAPESPALEYKQRWYSWAEMSSLMTQANDLLTNAGLGEGAPIGILLRNRPAHVTVLLQILASRRCVVTLNPFQSAEKIAHDLEATQIGALIADEQDWQAPALQAAAQAKGCLGLSISSGDTLTVAPQPGVGIKLDPATLPDLRETAVMMLSSGTTGPAKRIALPYAKFEASLSDAAHYEAGKATNGLTLKTSPAMLTIPLVHIGGMYFAVAAIVAARPIVILEKFSVLEWSQAVATYRPKMVSLPPTAIRMILDADVAKSDIDSLLAIRTGSAPLDPAMQIEFENRYDIPLLDAYGATEFAGAVAGWSLRDHREFAQHKRGSVGRAQPGCEVRIIDLVTHEVIDNNNIGLLEVRSAQVDATRWVRTTDLAEIDDDGFIFIRGRSDSAIIRGGFKVLPRDVEHVLREHPAVKEICVVGLPDPRLGAVPVAALEVRPGVDLDENQLIAFAREKLVAYQVPVRWMVVDNLPRTPSLKISQHEVRQLFTAPEAVAQTAV